MDKSQFHWLDYVVCILSMVISLLVGIYSAWKERSSSSMEGYVLGNREMKPLLIGVSLIASNAHASLILMGPVEVYMFGIIQIFSFFGQLISMFFEVTFYVPVLHSLKLTSAYQYMEIRFQSPGLRAISSVLFLLCTAFQTGLVLYFPAMAFTQVTGVSLYATIVFTGILCTIYTCFGGLRSVVYVDALQAAILLIGMITFVILGIRDVGGISTVLKRALDGGRLHVGNFHLDPRKRYTVWSTILGFPVIALSGSMANQVVLQRYFSAASLKDARRSNFLGVMCAFPLCLFYGIMGIVMYAYYHDCDPISTRMVQRPEQLVPDYMMSVSRHLPGVPGVCMAALFAGALSTLSSNINSMAAVCVEDFLSPAYTHYKHKYLSSQERKKACMYCTLAFGLLSIVTAFFPQIVGTLILQLGRIFLSAFMGPILTVFTLGIFVNFTNKWGSYAGLVASLLFALWMSLGSFYSKSFVTLPLKYTGCSFPFPPANFTRLPPRDDLPFQALYDVSYLWIGAYSLAMGLIVGVIVSIITSGCRIRRQPLVNCSTGPTSLDNESKEIVLDTDKDITSAML